MRPGNFLLFAVTSVELAILFVLTPTFFLVDWIYVLQHVLVLGVAFSRRLPELKDHSLPASAAVVVSYSYSYAQVAYLRWVPGDPAWPDAGLVMVTLAAFSSLASLVTLNRRFGVWPAFRGLATQGPYRIVRHPMYLAYAIADLGYNFEEWNFGTASMVAAGWLSLLYRIHAEERVLSRNAGWSSYAARVRYRLIPGIF